MSKLRVAHIITRLSKGGAQENTFHTVRLADRDRYDVDLISGPTEGHEGSIEDMVSDAEIDVVRVSHLVRDPAPLRDMLALRALTELLKQRQYDIVHTHTSKAGYLGRIAAHRAGVKHIVHTAHGNIFDGYFSALKTHVYIWMERHAARYTHRFIELTPGGIDEYLARRIGTAERYRVVFSGVDFAPFEQARAERALIRAALGIAPEAFLVGGVGRLEPVKGFNYFVEAALLLARENPALRFILAGDGSQRAQLETMAAPLGNAFTFLGLRADVPAVMAAMDVFVLPSVNEGMGRVLLEAGAAGTPIVATRVGGVPDLLRNGELGVLVAPRDAAALADGVRQLHDAPAVRESMAERAHAAFVPHYSVEEMVRQIEAIYEELVRAKPA